jgi:hypothetical protein
VRRGLPTPAVQKAVDKIRPEGAARGADHTGFGTLLYARTADDPNPAPRTLPPAALHAVARGKAVELDWLRTCAEASTILDRGSTRIDVPARGEFYRDTHVVPARRYTYRLLAPSPTAFTSTPVSIATSLPAGWTSGALGNPAVAGDVQFDGTVFTVCAAGKGLMQPIDEGHFVAAASHASRIEVRFIPQTASQFAAFGLACRSGFEANAPSVTLLILPADDEHRGGGWHVQLMVRDSGGHVTTMSDSPLTAPVVTYGRLMKSVWLRLESKGSLLQAAFSTDGSVWIPAGQAPRVEESRIGLIAASGIPEVATSVRFELAPPDRNLR